MSCNGTCLSNDIRGDTGGIFVIRDLLKIFSVKCDCCYLILVNCDLYTTVIRDFINIFLFIRERDIIFVVKMTKKSEKFRYY